MAVLEGVGSVTLAVAGWVIELERSTTQWPYQIFR
jgi:hypothetical protein